MTCSACGSDRVTFQTVQENTGSTTISTTKSKYREKGHGIWWWLLVGWWWWMIDLMLWIFLFIPRLIAHAGRKRKYKGTSKTTANTVNNIRYVQICTCQNCGNTWKKYLDQ